LHELPQPAVLITQDLLTHKKGEVHLPQVARLSAQHVSGYTLEYKTRKVVATVLTSKPIASMQLVGLQMKTLFCGSQLQHTLQHMHCTVHLSCSATGSACKLQDIAAADAQRCWTTVGCKQM
jgi:hypothetical protein